jgi:hypothetical protein
LRTVIGIALIAFATRLGFPETGWNWISWIGVLPIVTGVIGWCPPYALLLGINTDPSSRER